MVMDKAAGIKSNLPDLSTFQQDYLSGCNSQSYTRSAAHSVKLPYFVTDKQAPSQLKLRTASTPYIQQQPQAHIYRRGNIDLENQSDPRTGDCGEESYTMPDLPNSETSTAMATPSSSRHSSRQIFSHNLKSSTSLTWTEEKERILKAPYDYLFSHPGKDIRKQMIAGFNVWLKVPKQSLDVITKVVGMLHTSSLLIDDVEDMSLLRRGIPVAHSIFGHAQTINSANYIYFLALQELQKLQSPVAIDIFTHELLNLHRGQGMDLYWRDTLTCPSEQDYLEMVANKTGGLFRLAIKLMQAESSSTKNCIPLVDTIGMLFQILDDYHNLSSPTYTAHKGLAEDLTEGKFSFLIIHAICVSSSLSTNPSSSFLPGSEAASICTGADDRGATEAASGGSLRSNNVLINILRQKTTDAELKKWAIGYMRQMGSFSYARAWIDALREKALDLISQLEEADHDTTDDDNDDNDDSNGRQRSGDAISRIVSLMKVSDSELDGEIEPSLRDEVKRKVDAL